jgi:AraC-like DNA-binding protein
MTFNALRIGQIIAACLRFGDGVHLSADTVDDYHVHVPLCGSARSRTGRMEPVLATSQQAMVFSPNAPAEAIWSDGCTQICLTFARHAVRHELEAMLDQPIVRPIEFAPAMSLTSESGKAWTTALDLLEQHTHGRSGVLDHPLATTNLTNLLIDNLLFAQPHNYSTALSQPEALSVPCTVRKAMELLQSHPERPWTTATLAREVAVSARGLQAGFHRSTGVPPMRYLREIRLEHVHSNLLIAARDSTTVSQVARRWGFLYLGRFAGAYREKFGETPSETLRRRP